MAWRRPNPLPSTPGYTEGTGGALPLLADTQKKERQWQLHDGFTHQRSAEEFLGRYSETARGHHRNPRHFDGISMVFGPELETPEHRTLPQKTPPKWQRNGNGRVTVRNGLRGLGAG